MWERLAVTPLEALAVVLSAIGMYFTFIVLIRLLGQRVLATMSSFDLAAVIALGAVAGRAILGYTPTLGAGIIGVATLVTLQALTGRFRQTSFGASLVSSRPLLLMAGAQVLHQNLRRAHMVEGELYSKLRLAGIRAAGEVACVILESTGTVTVLRRGELIDPALLEGIRDTQLIPPELVKTA